MDNQRQTHLRKGTGGVLCAAVPSNNTVPKLVKVRMIGECVSSAAQPLMKTPDYCEGKKHLYEKHLEWKE